MYSRYVRYVHQPPGAGPCLNFLNIWLAVSCPSRTRGAADTCTRYLCVVKFWSYLTITGNAPPGQSHLCHPLIYGSPASPLLLLSRMPITKYLYSRKPILAPQQIGLGYRISTIHHSSCFGYCIPIIANTGLELLHVYKRPLKRLFALPGTGAGSIIITPPPKKKAEIRCFYGLLTLPKSL
jgi:hypothetical protein